MKFYITCCSAKVNRASWTSGIRDAAVAACGNEVVAQLPGHVSASEAATLVTAPGIAIDSEISCSVRYGGSMLGLSAGRTLDVIHYLSAGAVSFARVA